MGESLVVENKMSGESIAHVPCLQESVSFGRFEHDTLCWERWSTFPTTNKYLEEVEKFSTPGSVAQKKAYFEAHYKRVIARKAELLDQERKRETESVNSEDKSQSLIMMDPVCSSSEGDSEVEKSNDPLNGEENEVVNFSTEVVGDHIDEPYGGADVIKENEDLQPEPEHGAEDLCSKEESPELKSEEPEFVKQEADSSLVSQDKIEEREIAKKETQDLLKLVKEMHKATPVKKTINSASARKKTATPPMMPKGSATSMPRKSAAPAQKSLMLSTPKSSKPVLSKTVMSTTRPPLVKKENGLTPLSGKKTARPETKRVLPTSLHMSLSLEPTNSTTRKSLIMERMGDKDIVKRAFKAFQNGNQVSPSGLAKSPATNQSVTKKIEQKGSGSGTLQKKSEGLRSVKAASSLSGLQGTGKTSLSTGLRRTAGVNQRNGKPIPSSFGSRSLDLGNKQKEVSKKLEQKAKEASKIHLPSKATLEKTAELRRLSQSINSRAKLSSSCNQGPPLRVLLKDAEFFTRR